MYAHFDVENFEASVQRYIGTLFSAYSVLYTESETDFNSLSGKWFFIEFLGHEGEVVNAPVNHIMVHIRTRGAEADANMTLMTRLAINTLKNAQIDLYDLDSDVPIGKLRSVIMREFPKEVARQASGGFNRSILVRVTYGKVGVAYV